MLLSKIPYRQNIQEYERIGQWRSLVTAIPSGKGGNVPASTP
ncbi:hypothetical protein [Oscillatoria acuminata]|nr:hypothetical protein [Oscillatoria acuminata]